ncbi:hypothetical protein QJQ45_001006 [Haematococcus lacustris]|nr:hypothetical protein QJQ45_001006 [Haematococcus lacustris]
MPQKTPHVNAAEESRHATVILDELVRLCVWTIVMFAMLMRWMHSDASVDGAPVDLPSTPLGPLSGTSLLDLPGALLDDVACRAIQLGVGGGMLSLTCRAFSKTNLLLAPALHFQLDNQGCDQFLTPRVVAALQARKCKLALTLEQQRAQSSMQYIMLLPKVLKKLTNCAAVEACKLGIIQGPTLGPYEPLGCSLGLAQQLMSSFPGLTSLSLHGYAITCSGLAALLAHPQLNLQLQQLDLSSTIITHAEQPEPGAATLASLFHASRLKQLSLLINNISEHEPLLPNLQPLSQHLTQLCLVQLGSVVQFEFVATLQPLTQLQVLTVSDVWYLWRLPGLLQALPQLHTLQLPDTVVLGHDELDALLAATQLTSIKLKSLQRLTSACADVPCSWQQLELTGSIDCSSAAHLPLHILTQPLVLGRLAIHIGSDKLSLVAAAVHNLTQACSVPVRIKELWLTMSDVDMAAKQQIEMQPLVAVLQALKHCSWERVCMSHMNVGAADVLTLAPLCQACTNLEFAYGSVTPSLKFWRQLVQLMPTVTHLIFSDSKGSDSAAMCKSLKRMADQPWARWLDICILRSPRSNKLHACWHASPFSQPGKLRVWFYTMEES